MKINKNIQSKYAIYLLAFLAFVLYNSMLPGITYYAVIFSVLVFLSAETNKYRDKNFSLILSFALFYSVIPLFSGVSMSMKGVVCSIIPPAFYIFGRYIVSRANNSSTVVNVIAGIVLFFALNTYILCITDMISTGQLINVTRSMSRFVGTEEDQVMAATGFGINISLGFVGLAVFLKEKRRGLRHYVLLSVFILSLLVTVHLVNRTGVILSVLVSTVLLFLSFNSNNRRNLILGIIALGFFLYILYENTPAFTDIVEAYTAREETEMNSGMFNTGSRSWRWIDGLQRLFSDPIGYADKMPEGYFVHNMWLDVSRSSGLLPFILVLLITIRMAKLSVLILVKSKMSEFSFVCLGLCICFLASFFMEPVLEGCAIYFYLFCLIWGMEVQYYKRVLNHDIDN